MMSGSGSAIIEAGSLLARPTIIGRAIELAEIDRFLAGAQTPARALVISGESGIGKTTLLDAAAVGARDDGMRVLNARAGSAEGQLSFASLADLLAGVDDDVLARLPGLQRRALEVALGRAVAGPDDPHAIALGVLGALKALAERSRVLVAIDDCDLLDRASLTAVAFAVRRLAPHPVQFVLARRRGARAALEQAWTHADVRRLAVGPLTIGATRQMLLDHLGMTLPRHVLRQVHQATHGNPLFALEVGRAIGERGLPGIACELVLPDDLSDLLGARIQQLAAGVRDVLAASELSGGASAAELEAVVGIDALDDALDADVVVLDGTRIRPAHPLLGAVAARRLSPGRARALHRRLAAGLDVAERRARHLALATDAPDTSIAAIAATAAERVSERGAALDAVELAAHALRLTPADASERAERVLTLGVLLGVAGERERASQLLDAEFDTFPPGLARIRALLLLAGGRAADTDAERLIARASAEAGDDPVLRAPVLAHIAERVALGQLERLGECSAWAAEALDAAPRAGRQVARHALVVSGWTRLLSGLPLSAGGSATLDPDPSLGRLAGIQLACRGSADAARSELRAAFDAADARGEAPDHAATRVNLCELELRTGDWPAAARLVDEALASPEADLLPSATLARLEALLAAGRGDAEQAAARAASALAGGAGWDRLESLRARALAAMLSDDHESATEDLQTVWAHTRRERIDEIGAFPVAADLVEALVDSRRVEPARVVANELTVLAEAQEHPWGLATAVRSRALIDLVSGGTEIDAAVADMHAAARDYERLGLRFDHARTLLALGRAARRRRKWKVARTALEAAAGAFDALASPGWAALARGALERVGGRPPGHAGELTASERRIAEMACAGLANKEIANALVITIHTVETHLTHVYGKLGIRSRMQLAHYLSAQQA